jgi:hypothetical protein
MGTVTDELVLVRMEDIAALAEARQLVCLTGEVIAATPRGLEENALGELRSVAVTSSAVLLEALRSPSEREMIRRLRHSELAIAELRRLSWELYRRDVIAAELFDELMVATARCHREVEKLEVETRRRARWSIDGTPI